MSQVGSPLRLAPVTSEAIVSASDVVARALREAILRGKFAPGERLVQDELAAELKVSRQPVREALRRMESEGLVVRVPQRGVVVREYSDEEVRENYHLRQLLESEAASLAAGRIGSKELEEVKAANRAMADAISAHEVQILVELNAKFHRLVHESSRMSTLVRLINQLWVGFTILAPVFVPGRASRSVKEHQEIIAALEERDPKKAASAMRDHIERGASEYFRSGLRLGQLRGV